MLTVCSQLCYLDSFRVDADVASHAVHAAVTSVPSAIAIASRLVDDLRDYRLSCTLRSSKDEFSTCGVDWRVLWYVYVDTICADPSPVICMLGPLSFTCIR